MTPERWQKIDELFQAAAAWLNAKQPGPFEPGCC